MIRIARMLCIWSLSVLSLLSSTVTVGHAEEGNINEIEIPVVGSYEGITFWWRTAMADHYLFATDWDWTKLYVFDVANPTAPTLVASSNLPGEWGPDLQAAGQWPIYSIYLLRQSGLATYRFDATSGHLSQVGQSDAFAVPFSPYHNLALHGTYAYIAHGYAGLHIMDISDPTHPSELTRYRSDGSINYVVALGMSAFLAVSASGPTTDGLRVVDISNPYAITEISRYELGIENDGVEPVVVAGGYAFLAWDGPMLSDPYLDIVELSTMHRMARLAVGTPVSLVAIRDQHLLVGHGIFDISDVMNPKHLGFYKLGRGGGSIRRPESYVYSAGAGLHILDLRGLRETQVSITPPFSWGSIKSRFK